MKLREGNVLFMFVSHSVHGEKRGVHAPTYIPRSHLHHRTKWPLKRAVRILLECVFVTARVAKRAKVMFSQVFVILSPNGGGGGRWATLMVNHLPPPGWDQVTTPPSLLPPRMRPGYNTSPPPPGWDQVTTPSPPGSDQITTPPPPLQDKTRLQHLPPPGTMHRRAVRILLECILVYLFFAFYSQQM